MENVITARIVSTLQGAVFFSSQRVGPQIRLATNNLKLFEKPNANKHWFSVYFFTILEIAESKLFEEIEFLVELIRLQFYF